MSGATYRSFVPQVKAQAERKAQLIVRKAAFDLKAKAQRNTPVDTGYLKGSLYTEFTGPMSAKIGFSASYAIFVEKGTRGRPGKNMLGKAFVATVRPMQDAFKELIG